MDCLKGTAGWREPVSLLHFLGDVWLPKPVRSNVSFQGDVILNLESPITKSTKAMPGKINLKAESNCLTEVFGRPPLAVCLANNHIMDFCDEGFFDTLASLEENNTKYFGAGELAANCNNPLMLDIGGTNVALLGYSRPVGGILADRNHIGAMPADMHAIINDIAAARRAGATRVILSFHWGAMEVYLPKPEDVQMAHKLVDAGADLIVGHHAHRIQAYEVYRNRHVFYGLGNCIFPDLDVPSHFDQAGQSHGRRIDKQQPWNRISLAVSFDVNTAKVGVSVLSFDGEELNVAKHNAGRYMQSFASLSGYESKYRRSWVRGNVRAVIARYLSQPKLPRWRHVRRLASLLLGRGCSS